MKYIYSLIVIFLVACGNKPNNNSLFPEISPKKDIKYESIIVDTIEITDTTSSFVGHTFVNNGKVYFADEYFSYLYEFDPNGNLVARHLGEGESNKELSVGHSMGAEMFDDGRNVYLGHQIDVHLYGDNFERLKIFQIKNYFDKDTTADPYDLPEIYSYPGVNFIVRGYGDAIYLNTSCEGQEYSSILFPKRYCEGAHPIMKVGLTSEKVEGMLWGLPPAYSEHYEDKGTVDHVVFDIDRKGNFYMNCEADSTIYVYTKDWKPVKAYGYQGRDLDRDYPKDRTYEAVNAVWEETRKKGLYQWLEYIDDTGLLFRTYSKSEKADTWGMQIFSDNKMIADVDVPIGFKVKGYIAPYYYGEIIANPDTRTMKILRFKLD